VIPKGRTLLRSDVLIRMARAKVYVVSLQRRGATTNERLDELAFELRQLRDERVPLSKAVLKHPRTVATLQLLARLGDRISKLEAPVGDARLVDTLPLIKRHIKLIRARGFELPEVTREVVIEKFDWHGNHYATGSRYLHTELLDVYRKTFAAIARDARKARKATTDERAREQFLALRQLSESLHRAIAVTVLPRR